MAHYHALQVTVQDVDIHGIYICVCIYVYASVSGVIAVSEAHLVQESEEMRLCTFRDLEENGIFRVTYIVSTMPCYLFGMPGQHPANR